MIAWSSLLLPALLAAVLVFIASSLIHMVLKWHNSDYKKLPNEDEVRAAIRRGSPAPGEYIIPHALDGKECGTPEMKKKFEEGPIGTLFVRPNGMMKLGPFLGSWFVYTFIVALLAGYVARETCPIGTEYLKVFQIVGASAWLAFAWQAPSNAIWKGVPWTSTLRTMFDGLIYACLTAGSFAWLWPHS